MRIEVCSIALVLGALAACAGEDHQPTSGDPAPDAMGVIPMVVNIGTDVGPGTEVELVEVGRWRGGWWHGDIYWTEVAVQVKLKGTATGPSGAEMRINLTSSEDVYHLGSPGQQFSYQDSTIDINSDNFTSGSCGSWTPNQVTYDLKCEIPNGSQGTATSWTYSEARTFAFVLDPVHDTYTFVFDVRAFKNNDDEFPANSDAVACRRLIRTETQQAVEDGYYYTHSDTNGPCT